MSMDDFDILEVLQTAALAARAASSIPTVPIKMVGRTLDDPNAPKWIEVVWIPNNRTGDFWGGEKNYQGLFRLILHWPNNDEGAYPPGAALKSLASYFTKDRHLGPVKITEPPNLSGPLESGSETLYVAAMRYGSFRP